MSQDILDNRFSGLAFPVAVVKYTGNGYAASIRRDNEHTFRARTSYDHSLSPSENARVAARKCFAKACAELGTTDEHVAIPGDLSANSYCFTFIPAEMLA